MKLEHHDLDPYPIPKEKQPLYVNEPWLIDDSICEYSERNKNPENEKDNIRIYVPLDINRQAVLRRLDRIIARYGEASEANESDFSLEVERLFSQVEIYDQIWHIRHMAGTAGTPSREAIALVREMAARLNEIPDACAETFPFRLIECRLPA